MIIGVVIIKVAMLVSLAAYNIKFTLKIKRKWKLQKEFRIERM